MSLTCAGATSCCCLQLPHYLFSWSISPTLATRPLWYPSPSVRFLACIWTWVSNPAAAAPAASTLGHLMPGDLQQRIFLVLHLLRKRPCLGAVSSQILSVGPVLFPHHSPPQNILKSSFLSGTLLSASPRDPVLRLHGAAGCVLYQRHQYPSRN